MVVFFALDEPISKIDTYFSKTDKFGNYFANTFAIYLLTKFDDNVW